MNPGEPEGGAEEDAAVSPRPLRAPIRSRRPEYRRTYGRIEVGRVLGRTFELYGRNFVAFSLISLVVHLPLLVYTWLNFDLPDLETASDVSRFQTRGLVWSFVFIFGGMLLGSLAAGPVTYGVIERLGGRRPSLGACVAQGLRRMPRILGVGARLIMYVFGVALVTVFLGMRMTIGVFGAGVAGQLLAAVVLAFPVLAVLSLFWVAVPVAMVEEKGSSGAMGRSASLTSHNFWKAFGILLLFFVMEQGASHLVVTLMPDSEHIADLRTVFCVQVLVSALLFGPLRAVASAIGYHDLRTTKEGIDTGEIARVFE